MRKKADASRKGASAFCAFGDLFAGAIRQRGRIDPVCGKCAGKEKITERRKSSTRGKRHNHGTEKVTSRVQRVYRAGEAFGMARHSCGMGKVSSRVQRVYRTAKTSGAVKHATRARGKALRARGEPHFGCDAMRSSCGTEKVTFRVQRVYRTAKTSGAMKDTSCPWG